MNRVGYRQIDIAEEIGVHPSTIGRELKRNTGLRGYRPNQAQQLALSRRGNARARIRESHGVEVERLLRAWWSPEQISWRLYEEQDYRISHEWIYRYIYQDKRLGGHLYRYLRCQKQRKKRYGTNERRGCIPQQTMIDDRPAVVDQRSRIGDWEGDTVIGNPHPGALATLVERKSRYLELGHLARKTRIWSRMKSSAA